MSSIGASPAALVLPAGAQLIDGETFTLTDSQGATTVVELTTATSPAVGTDVLVTYIPTDTAAEIVNKVRAALDTAGLSHLISTDTVSLPVVTAVDTSTFAVQSSASSSGISVPAGDSIVGGEVIQLTDSTGRVTTVELSTSGVSITGADLLVTFTTGDDAATIAGAIKAALIGVGIGSFDDPNPSAGRGGVLFNAPAVTAINDVNSLITVAADVVTVPDGAGLIDGETITVADGLGGVVVVEFNTTGVASPGSDVVVQYVPAATNVEVASALTATLNGLELGALDNADGTVTLLSVSSAVVIPPMTSIVASPTEFTLPDANQLIDGETITMTVDGSPVVIEFNTTGVASAGTDYVVAFTVGDSADQLIAGLETTLRADGYAVTANGNTMQLHNAASTVVAELEDVAGDFDVNLSDPYNESEQSLRVVSFTTSLGTVRVPDGFTGTQTLGTANNGLLTLQFANGVFVSGTYAPPINYNELPPFQPVDLFTYRIADNGRTTLPVANLVRILGQQESVEEATVTISVKPANDRPYIENLGQVDVTEDPTTAQATIPDVFTTVLPATPNRARRATDSGPADGHSHPSDRFARCDVTTAGGHANRWTDGVPESGCGRRSDLCLHVHR